MNNFSRPGFKPAIAPNSGREPASRVPVINSHMRAAQPGNSNRPSAGPAPRENAVAVAKKPARPEIPNAQRNNPPRIYTPANRPLDSAVAFRGRPAPISRVNPTEAGQVKGSPTRSQSQIQRVAAPNIVIQRIKYYPNLHPGAAVPVERNNIFKLDYFADQYRLHKLSNHGAYVPNLKYNFVRTQGGDMLVHNRFRHPSLADGQQVLYAGEVSFNNGKLNWWSNGSGHYQPDEDYAKQAGLPMDQFYSYQQILKGEHERKKDSK